MSSDPRKEKQYFLDKTKLSRAALFFFGLYFWLVMQLQVIGLENVPSTGGVLLVSNHLAQIDSFLLLHILPRPISFMAKEEIFVHPASDYFCRHLGAFPVHRDRLDTWALKYALREVLAKGNVLGIYPEGERSEGKQLQEAKVGPAFLAIKSKRPLIPIAITGTHRVFAAALAAACTCAGAFWRTASSPAQRIAARANGTNDAHDCGYAACQYAWCL